MSDHDTLALLAVIKTRTQRALSIVQQMNLGDFLADSDAQDVAFACVSDIGEALNHMKRTHPFHAEQISDLQDIINSRNEMSHGLFSRDYERFWYDLVDGLPLLHKEAQDLLDSITANRQM